MRVTSLLAAAALAAVPAAPASAAPPDSYVLIASSTYLLGDVTVPAGGRLILVTTENNPHDLISSDVENGNPLFKSRIVNGPGDRAEVIGVPLLGPGIHPFYCSLHESMRGTITVAS